MVALLKNYIQLSFVCVFAKGFTSNAHLFHSLYKHKLCMALISLLTIVADALFRLTYNHLIRITLYVQQRVFSEGLLVLWQ